MFLGSGSLTFKWLTGILVTVVFALTALWANNLTGQVRDIGKKVDEQAPVIAEMKGQFPQMAARLKRIEDNQDAVARNLAASRR